MNELEDVIAHEPDRTIRKLVGDDVKLADIFTKEKMAAGQKTIDDARHVFFDEALAEMAKLDDLLAKNPQLPDEKGLVLFDEIAAYVGDIKGQAELFGFTLLVAIGDYILDCCESRARPPATRYRLLTDLCKMLRLAVKEKITDEKSPLGRELKISLGRY